MKPDILLSLYNIVKMVPEQFWSKLATMGEACYELALEQELEDADRDVDLTSDVDWEAVLLKVQRLGATKEDALATLVRMDTEHVLRSIDGT